MTPQNAHTIWDTSAIEFDDIPTVQDLFCVSNHTMLVEEIMRIKLGCAHNTNVRPSKKHLKHLRQSVEKTLDTFCRFSIKPSPKWCIFPDIHFAHAGNNTSISCYIQGFLARRKELALARREIKTSHPYLARSDVHADGLRQRRSKYCRVLSEYNLALMSHKKALGARVWMAGDFSRKERYCCLASIFCTMTSLGFNTKEQRKKAKREKALLKENLRELTCAESSAMPAEIVRAGHKGVLAGHAKSADFGLQASTDDYEQEHTRNQSDLIVMLNHNAHLELCRRVCALDRMLQQGYRVHRTPTEAPHHSDGLALLLKKLYAKPNLSFQDLPTLYDLFAAANSQRLIARIHNDARAAQFLPNQAHDILTEMLSLDCKRNNGWYLFVAYKNEELGESCGAKVKFTQVRDALLAKRAADISGGDWYAYRKLRHHDTKRARAIASEEEARAAADHHGDADSLPSFENEAFRLYAFGNGPWAEDLSCKAWIARHFSDTERYNFLANVFFGLTERWKSELERIEQLEGWPDEASVSQPQERALDEKAWQNLFGEYGQNNAAAAEELIGLVDHFEASKLA